MVLPVFIFRDFQCYDLTPTSSIFLALRVVYLSSSAGSGFAVFILSFGVRAASCCGRCIFVLAVLAQPFQLLSFHFFRSNIWRFNLGPLWLISRFNLLAVSFFPLECLPFYLVPLLHFFFLSFRPSRFICLSFFTLCRFNFFRFVLCRFKISIFSSLSVPL